MTILFFILFFIIFGKLINIAIRATWGTMKVMFYILFLPLILVALMLKGLVFIAFPLLFVLGLISLLKTA